jgi:hypothetical protein
MSSTGDDLKAFAERHIAHEVRMLAKLPGAINHQKTVEPRPDPVVLNALYEDLLVHARLLDEFLSNCGDGRSVKASDYIPDWRPRHSEPVWRKAANQRVAHLDRHRTSPGVDGPLNPTAESIRHELGVELCVFYAALPEHCRDWFAGIPEYFSEEMST